MDSWAPASRSVDSICRFAGGCSLRSGRALLGLFILGDSSKGFYKVGSHRPSSTRALATVQSSETAISLLCRGNLRSYTPLMSATNAISSKMSLRSSRSLFESRCMACDDMPMCDALVWNCETWSRPRRRIYPPRKAPGPGSSLLSRRLSKRGPGPGAGRNKLWEEIASRLSIQFGRDADVTR